MFDVFWTRILYIKLKLHFLVSKYFSMLWNCEVELYIHIYNISKYTLPLNIFNILVNKLWVHVFESFNFLVDVSLNKIKNLILPFNPFHLTRPFFLTEYLNLRSRFKPARSHVMLPMPLSSMRRSSLEEKGEPGFHSSEINVIVNDVRSSYFYIWGFEFKFLLSASLDMSKNQNYIENEKYNKIRISKLEPMY